MVKQAMRSALARRGSAGTPACRAHTGVDTSLYLASPKNAYNPLESAHRHRASRSFFARPATTCDRTRPEAAHSPDTLKSKKRCSLAKMQLVSVLPGSDAHTPRGGASSDRSRVVNVRQAANCGLYSSTRGERNRFLPAPAGAPSGPASKMRKKEGIAAC
jgi:hypothetical protein